MHERDHVRVAVIGTGASASQVVPNIQRDVRHLTVVQRTAPCVIPRADRQISGLEQWLHSRVPLTRALRRQLLWSIRELQVGAFAKHPGQLRALEKMALLHMRRAVRDPELRRQLTPDYRIGCKRILLSNDWYPTLARPHVDLVPAGLTEVRGSTLVAADGSETEVDAIILGTGFHVTDLPIAQRVTGADGTTLAEQWQGGMAALRGATAVSFPNLLFIIGPNTGLGNSSMSLMIESQLNYLADYLAKLTTLGRAALTPRPEAVEAYNAQLQRRMERSVWNSGGCRSWYLDAAGRNTTVWPGTTGEFRRITRSVDLDEYQVLRAPAARATSGPHGSRQEGAVR